MPESTGKTVLISVATGLVMGIIVTNATNDTPPPPEVKTRVVEVPKRVEVVREVRGDFPRSCKMAAEAITKDSDLYGASTEAVGNILLALQDLNKSATMGEVRAVNEANQVVRDNRIALDNAAAEQAERTDTLQYAITECERDLND